MKQQIKKLLLAAAFCMFFISINAQRKSVHIAPWASDKGYWMIESNIHSPLNHIIRFYTPDNVLQYTENIIGLKLNTDKRKTKMKLKKALEATLLLCEKNKKPKENENFIALLLK